MNLGYEFEKETDSGVSHSIVASGTGTLNVLPLSDFPTTISYTHTDSRLDSEFAGVEFRGDRFFVSQRANIDDDLRAVGTFVFDRLDQGEDGQEQGLEATFAVTKNFEDSTLSATARHRMREFTSGVADIEDESDNTSVVTVTHEFTPAEDVRMQQTLLGLHRQETDEGEQFTEHSAQYVSTAQWRPADRPFTVNGAIRGLFDRVDASGGTATSDSGGFKLLNGTVGLNYQIMPRLNANVGLTAGYEDIDRSALGSADAGDEGERLRTAAIGSISYLSEEMELAGFQWHWDALATADVGIRSDEGLDEAEEVSAGHAATRTFETDLIGPLTISFDQDVTVSRETGESPTVSLGHTIGLSHTSVGEGTVTFVRLAVTDDRDIVGPDRDEFQLAQFILSRQVTIDLDSYWRADVNLQAVRQKFADEGTDTAFSATGEIAYVARDIFGVENLSFTSELILSTFGLPRIFPEDFSNGDDSDFFRADWRNRLEYRIGRMRLRLEATAFAEDEELGHLLLFRVQRDFGNNVQFNY
ncbi:MAG: hypothetical protein ACKVP3_01580 [Hyphomicrobiaceae bacterium]